MNNDGSTELRRFCFRKNSRSVALRQSDSTRECRSSRCVRQSCPFAVHSCSCASHLQSVRTVDDADSPAHMHIPPTATSHCTRQRGAVTEDVRTRVIANGRILDRHDAIPDPSSQFCSGAFRRCKPQLELGTAYATGPGFQRIRPHTRG